MLFSAIASGQVPGNTARALIIVSKHMVDSACSVCGSPWDWYNNNYKALFSEWNDVYTNSGMSYRVEIAGVIIDTTYTEGDDSQNYSHIMDTSHADLGKYHHMLDEFAADYLILHSWKTSGSADGWASTITPSVGHPAVIWLDTPGAAAWAHEAGHLHGLGHCTGYRQTYDGSNNFVTSGAVSGFYTVMQYLRGTPPIDGCDTNFVGDRTIDATFAMAFADPTKTFPLNGINRALGSAPTHSNTVSTHKAAEPDIQALFMTQEEVELDSNFNVDALEYANIIAVDRVTFHPGFEVRDGELKVEVGPNVLAKRGIPGNSYYIDEQTRRLKYPKSVKYFMVSNGFKSKTIHLNYEGDYAHNSVLKLYNSFGRIIYSRKIEMNSKKYESEIDVSAFQTGTYYVGLEINGQNLYRKVMIRNGRL
jgi:hypothetical protein